MDYGQEGSMTQIPVTGLSADYVFRETKRARAGLASLFRTTGRRDEANALARH